MTLPRLSWEERPAEIANLLNPAFCAVLLRDAAIGYQSQSSQTLPYPLAFLILPIVLYRPTREALPESTITILHAWIQEHPALQSAVIERVRRLEPYIREALLFALQHDILRVTEDGGLESALSRVRNLFPEQSEPNMCRKKAALVGRWFGKTADASMILAMWGLRP